MFFIFSKEKGMNGLKKWFGWITAFFLAAMLLSGCGAQEKAQNDNASPKTEDEAKETGFPVTIKDGADKEVTIEKKPEKIVSLMPSNTEIVYAIGAGDAVVGVSENDDYPKEAAEKEKVAGMELNVEKIISLKPDLVLAHGSAADMWEAGLKQLEDSGITVLVVHNAQSFEETFETIRMLGKATGHEKEAGQVVQDMKAKIDSIKEKAKAIKEEEQRTVFVELSPAPEIYAAGKNTFMDEMLDVIHAKNAVEEEGWPKMNEEAIISMNPDVIILNYNYAKNALEQAMARKGWQDMTAIKEKRVIEVNEDLTSRPGPRLAEGVEELAKAVYPDVFKE
jgi:iron complex transport system substrate-binding protein